MKRTVFVGSAVTLVACALLAATCARGSELTILAPDETSADADVLSKILRPDSPGGVQVVRTVQQAINSKSEVLVFFMGRWAPRLDAKAIAALRERKIIGIGSGAAELFGALGLEINGDACVTGPRDRSPEVRIETGIGGSRHKGRKFVAFRLDEDQPLRGRDYNLAMFLPRKDEATNFVDTIARRSDDANYAPIVKQGNQVLVGLAAPPATWTPEYKSFFVDMANALVRQAPVPFSKAQWETTKPGEHEFQLAKGFSTDDLFSRRFHFRFTKPTTFSATLSHSGSANVVLVLLFESEDSERLTQMEARKGEELRIDADISAADVRRNEDAYWSLDVTNFDRAAGADCRLKIEY